MRKKKHNRVPFTTKYLVETIERIFASDPERENLSINSKWQLQIRKKDLRRLRKKLKGFTIEGRGVYRNEKAMAGPSTLW